MLVLLISLALAPAAVESIDLELTLRRARAALGLPADGQSSATDPAFEWIGEQDGHPLTIRCDGRGRYVISDGARLVGDDGRIGWVTDGDGEVRRLRAPDRERARRLQWFRTGHWLNADNPDPFAVDATSSSEDLVALRFVSDAEDARGVIWLARGTGLPRRIRLSVGDDPATELEVLGYSERDGRRFPRRIRRTEDGLPPVTERYTDLRHLGPFLGDPFEAGATELSRARFADDSPTTELRCERARSGHLLLRPKVDGRRMGFFLFDSGSSANILDRGAAERLGLAEFGALKVQGITGELDAAYAQATSLTLGDLTVDAPRFTVMPTQALRRSFGRPIDGLIGFELLARVVAEVDPERGVIRLCDPTRYAGDDLEWISMGLTGRHPTVSARLDGLDVRLIVDTGSDTEVAIHRDVPGMDDILRGKRRRSNSVGGAASSHARADLVELNELVLASQRISPVEALIYHEQPGRVITEYSDGLLGLPLFRGRVLVLDYPRRRIAVRDR